MKLGIIFGSGSTECEVSVVSASSVIKNLNKKKYDIYPIYIDKNNEWYEVLDDFYKDFEPAVEDALEKLPKKEVKETGEMCPECGHPLVIRKGRYGEFVACSNFPKCKYIKQEPKEEAIICDCPNCEDGKIVEKRSKRGKLFYGCNNYPKCKTAYWDKPTGEKCPECGSMLTEKNGKIKCSNCDYKK